MTHSKKFDIAHNIITTVNISIMQTTFRCNSNWLKYINSFGTHNNPLRKTL